MDISHNDFWSGSSVPGNEYLFDTKEGTAVVSFTGEVNPRLAKRPLVFNGRLANRGLTSLVKEATGG